MSGICKKGRQGTARPLNRQSDKATIAHRFGGRVIGFILS